MSYLLKIIRPLYVDYGLHIVMGKLLFHIAYS